MSTQAEDLLRKLMTCFFINDGHLEWRYRDDITIDKVLGKETEIALANYLEPKEKQEYTASRGSTE
jgi:hypothetical protein